MKKSTQEESKRHNTRLVLRTISELGEVSRVDISRRTGLTRTTVSEIVARLMDEGLVSEIGISPSRGGKPAILLQLVSNARQIIGIDLANSELHGAIVNLLGQIESRVDVPIHDREREAALGSVFNLAEQLIEKTDRPVLGIGIGAPGLMDPQRGIVRQAVNLDWKDLPLTRLLQERFNLPVYLANDSQAAALGEFTFGKQGQASNLIVVKVGRGIGAGIILDGQPFYGDQSGAGEIGHLQVVANGERCRCGNAGCLETVASSRALVQQAHEIARCYPDSFLNQLVQRPEQITTETLLIAFQQGDPHVKALVTQAALYLSKIVNYLAGGLNVNRIILAGSLSQFGEGLAGPLRAGLQETVLPALAQEIKVEVSPLGSDIVVLGAASLLLSNELGLV